MSISHLKDQKYVNFTCTGKRCGCRSIFPYFSTLRGKHFLILFFCFVLAGAVLFGGSQPMLYDIKIRVGNFLLLITANLKFTMSMGTMIIYQNCLFSFITMLVFVVYMESCSIIRYNTYLYVVAILHDKFQIGY